MREIKPKDLPQLFKEEPFQFIRLLTAGKETVIGCNTKKGEVKKTQGEIIKILNSNLSPEGVYLIGHRPSMNGKENYIRVIKGTLSEAAPQVIEVEKEKSFLTYENALELEKKILQLEHEKKELQTEIERLNEYNKELAEGEPPTEKKDLLIELGLPLMDKAFTLFERFLLIKENKPLPPPPPPAAESLSEANLILQASADDLIYSYENAKDETQKAYLKALINKHRPEINLQ